MLHAAAQVDLIVDLLNPPKWFLTKYHDARPYDADGRNYTRLSWFHPIGQKWVYVSDLGHVLTRSAPQTD